MKVMSLGDKAAGFTTKSGDLYIVSRHVQGISHKQLNKTIRLRHCARQAQKN